MNELLVHVHIPKTAGTALRSALRKMVPNNKIYWIGTREHLTDEWQRLSARDLSRYKVLGGHRSHIELSQKIGHRNAVYSALLRDPIRRAVSYFEFLKNMANADVAAGKKLLPIRRNILSQDLLTAVTKNAIFRNRITNAQCYAISGAHSFAEATRMIENAEWIIETDANIDRLLQRISDRFGWPQAKAEQRNVSKRGYFEKLCTEEVAEEIRMLNLEDIQLFEKYKS